MTLGELLTLATKKLSSVSSSARLDAEILLAFTLNFSKAKLIASLSDPISEQGKKTFEETIARRLKREPVAYITGVREFYGREFTVTPDVLIPRPETEQLITEGLDFLKNVSTPRVLDLGTGSGCIAVTIAAERPDARVTATDISHAALNIAKKNSERLYPGNPLQFLEGSWFDALVDETSVFDLIISNPPYVSRTEQVSPETKFEPDGALYSSPGDGLDDVRMILKESKNYLSETGCLLVECGGGKHELLLEVVKTFSGACQVKGDVGKEEGWRYLQIGF